MARLFPNRILIPACLLALGCFAGCGDGNPKTYRIPGRLVYTDGKPVPGATVVLNTTHQEKRFTARGKVEPDGTFELTTFTDKDGVIEGEHTITVIPLPPQDGDKPAKSVVPPKYADSELSGLRFIVKPDTTEILITIEPPKR